MKYQKMRVYQWKQKSNHACLPLGAMQQQFACPSKSNSPRKLSSQDDITVLACASAMHIPV